MKTITIAAAALLSVGCNFSKQVEHSKPLSTSVTVAVDPSDTRVYYPTPDEVLRQFNFRERPEAACKLRLRLIGDRRHTPSKTLWLADAGTTEAGNTNFDPRHRERNLEAFINRVRSEMASFYNAIDTSNALQFSEIHQTITDELWRLSKDSSDRKLLLAITDCREKSDLFDSYRTKNFNIKDVAAKLTNAYPLPDNLRGITVIFLFSPRDREEDGAYDQCLELFRYMLDSRGATVEVKTNL
jgi:hypothetical protein